MNLAEAREIQNGVYVYEGSFPQRCVSTITSRIPLIIHVIWVGGDTPLFVKQHIEAWKALHDSSWTIRVWTDKDLSSEFFEDAALAAIRSAKNPAQKADIIKYHVIRDHGGFYVDADCEPVRSLAPLREALADWNAFGCHERNYDPSFPYLSCGFFAASVSHPWLQEACRLVLSVPLNTPTQHLTTGPSCLGNALAALRDLPSNNVLLLPTSYIYPTGEKNPDTTIYHQPDAAVFMVHRWLGSWVSWWSEKTTPAIERLKPEMKSHESWWERNIDTQLETFRGWLGGPEAPSRLYLYDRIRSRSCENALECGAGLCVDRIGVEKAGATYDAIDVTPKLVALARKENVQILQGSIEDLPYRDRRFDLVYCRHVLEHLPSPRLAMQEMLRVSAREVLVIFFVPPGDEEQISILPDMHVYQNRYARTTIEALATPEWETSWAPIHNSNEIAFHAVRRDSASSPEATS